MTLDEAIKHAREKADEQYDRAMAFHTDEGVYMTMENECRACAEEHEQLAEWLEELKQIKENE